MIFLAVIGTKKKLSIAYYPQTDSQIDRTSKLDNRDVSLDLLQLAAEQLGFTTAYSMDCI